MIRSMTRTRRLLLPALGLALLLLPGCLVAIGQDEWEHGRQHGDHEYLLDWSFGDFENDADFQRRADELERRLQALEHELQVRQQAAQPAPRAP
jgi:hypothetical protein